MSCLRLKRNAWLLNVKSLFIQFLVVKSNTCWCILRLSTCSFKHALTLISCHEVLWNLWFITQNFLSFSQWFTWWLISAENLLFIVFWRKYLYLSMCCDLLSDSLSSHCNIFCHIHSWHMAITLIITIDFTSVLGFCVQSGVFYFSWAFTHVTSSWNR